ncbi:histidine ammonia-lyase, partial [Vibrio fortis]
YLSAAQGLDFRAPNKSSARVEEAKQILREKVSFYDKDRYFAPDIEQANLLLKLSVHNHLMPDGILCSF